MHDLQLRRQHRPLKVPRGLRRPRSPGSFHTSSCLLSPCLGQASTGRLGPGSGPGGLDHYGRDKVAGRQTHPQTPHLHPRSRHVLLACPLLGGDLSPNLGQILQEEGLPGDRHGGRKGNWPSDPGGMVSGRVQLGLFGHRPCRLERVSQQTSTLLELHRFLFLIIKQ